MGFLLQYCHNIDVALDAQNRRLVTALNEMYSRILLEAKKEDADSESRRPESPPE